MHEHDGDGNTGVFVSDEEWQRAADFMKYEHNDLVSYLHPVISSALDISESNNQRLNSCLPATFITLIFSLLPLFIPSCCPISVHLTTAFTITALVCCRLPSRFYALHLRFFIAAISTIFLVMTTPSSITLPFSTEYN